MTKEEAKTILGVAAVLGAEKRQGHMLLNGLRIGLVKPNKQKHEWRISLQGTWYNKFSTAKKRVVRNASKA